MAVFVFGRHCVCVCVCWVLRNREAVTVKRANYRDAARWETWISESGQKRGFNVGFWLLCTMRRMSNLFTRRRVRQKSTKMHKDQKHFDWIYCVLITFQPSHASFAYVFVVFFCFQAACSAYLWQFYLGFDVCDRSCFSRFMAWVYNLIEPTRYVWLSVSLPYFC